MAFRDNSTLISTAARMDVTANGSNDVMSGAGRAFAFVIADGAVGDDTFTDFGSNDSLLTGRKIFDGNNDGYIAFGPNGVLDVDRTSSRRPGEDQLSLVGSGDNAITEIRYLGTKDGLFAYADAATRRNLLETFENVTVKEGTVGDDTITAGSGATVILHDNALGLNMGGDTITGFGADDLLVTTAALFDSDSNETVTFGRNLILDVSGAEGPQSSDPSTGPGGQLDLNDPNQVAITFLGESTIDGIKYYYYGTADSTVTLPTDL